MQIKKEVFLFGLLIVFSMGLLIASSSFSNATNTNTSPCEGMKGESFNCCQENIKEKSESPWNFITSGIVHLWS